MSTISELIHWVEAFRSSRNSISRGSPLWAYKVTDHELAEMQDLLKSLSSSVGIHTVINRYESVFSEGFVLYAATWLQRNSHGRSKWAPVLSSIGADGMDTNERISLVAKGLSKWGLRVFNTDTSNRYLDTLACQGGFPRSDLLQESSSHISTYFDTVLRYYERYQHTASLDDVALYQLDQLPITLQQSAFADLVTRLIERLLDWKAHYDLGVYKDAVKVLDNERPRWRDELPFLVMDAEAQTLINKLLKRTVQFQRREMNPVRVKRQLTPVGDDYRLTAELYIAKVIHPEDLKRQIGEHSLPNVFLMSTQTEDGSRFKTASFDLRSGPSGGWQVTSYHRLVNNSVASGELRFSISSEGRHILEDTYYRGEALEPGVPWVFEVSSAGLNYLGQGGVRSNKDRLVVVSDTEPRAANALAGVKRSGGLIDSDLSIFEVTGEVDVDALSGSYRIKCNAGDNHDYKVRITSTEYVDVEAALPIYLGPPEIQIVRSGVPTSISSDELFWYSKGLDAPIPLDDPRVFGAGALVWRSEGQLLWEKRCIVFPPKFEYRVTHVDGTDMSLNIRNAQRPKVGIGDGCDNWLETAPSYEANEIRVDFVPRDARASAFNLMFQWGDHAGSECQIGFPISFDIAILTDRKGVPYRVLERGALTVNDIPNLQIVIRTDQAINSVRLLMKLQGKKLDEGFHAELLADSVEMEVDHVDGKSVIKGTQISETLERMFGVTDQLESHLDLFIFAHSNAIPTDIPPIKRYKHDPEFIDSFAAFTLNPTPTLKGADDPVLYLSPIWDLGRDPIELRPDDVSANVWRFALPDEETVEYGGWLIWAPAEFSVHPRLKLYAIPRQKTPPAKLGALGAQLLNALSENSDEAPYEEPLKPGSLPYRVKYLKPSDKPTMKALNNSIRNLGFDINHPGWEYIDGVIKRIDAIDPLALYSMTAMQWHTRTLAALLFRYPDRFQEMWELAPRLGLSWYFVEPRAWIEVIQAYFESYKEAGKPLLSIDEEDYWRYVYSYFEKFEAKGPYFKYLIDIALDRPCFEPVDIWADDELKANGLAEQTVAGFHNAAFKQLMDTHQGRLLDRIGTKKVTENFLTAVSEFWPTSKLPEALDGFIRLSETAPSEYSTKQNAYTLTLAVPLKLGFCLSRYAYMPSSPRQRLWLSQAISCLDRFDRTWLQNALIVAHMACEILAMDDAPASPSEQEITTHE